MEGKNEMKKIVLLLCLLFLIIPSTTFAQDNVKTVGVAWDYNLVNQLQYMYPADRTWFDICTGFRVYVGPSSRSPEITGPNDTSFSYSTAIDFDCQVTRAETGEISNVTCSICGAAGTGSNTTEDPNSSQCQVTITNLIEGSTYYLTATAYEKNSTNQVIAESLYSNEISYTVPLNKFTITSTTGANGTVTPLGAVDYDRGGSATYTITPNSGYTINDVTVDGTSVGSVSSYTFNNIQATHTISATFTNQKFTITASAGAGGSISPTGVINVNYGASQSYSITPQTGYDILDVLVDGSSRGPITSHTFSNITTNHTISATFTVKKYTIVASAGSGGSISPSGNVSVNYGSTQTFNFTPSSGYRISNVNVDGVSVGTGASYTFNNITSGHTITVTFIRMYVITASAGSGGSISPSGSINVDEGSSQSFSITPNSGYQVDNVMVDLTPIGKVTSYQFTGITNNHTIEAYFSVLIVNYPITLYVNNAGGRIDGPTSVQRGTDATYSFAIYEGYKCRNIKLDGTSIGCVSSYTLTNVQSSHKIELLLTPRTPGHLRRN